jgi:glutaredoxin
MDAKLYHLEHCPYCRRVRAFIAQRALEPHAESHDVAHEPAALERLVELTGRTQVPVLEVDGEPIVGADVIIDWLDENAVALSGRHERNAPRASGTAASRAY